MPAHKALRPLVVKLGGSLAGSPDLAAWIAALDRYRGALVVVPGGGAFADAVRDMQTKLRFDDATAHHLALVAMEQYGIALAAQWPRMAYCATSAALQRALRMNAVACWAPAHMALPSDLPKSWDVTSDSLAAWLAGELHAAQLLLIKRVEPGDVHEIGASDLVGAGLVDPLFPHFAAASGADIFIAGPSALADAASLFAKGLVPGAQVRLR